MEQVNIELLVQRLGLFLNFFVITLDHLIDMSNLTLVAHKKVKNGNEVSGIFHLFSCKQFCKTSLVFNNYNRYFIAMD